MHRYFWNGFQIGAVLVLGVAQLSERWRYGEAARSTWWTGCLVIVMAVVMFLIERWRQKGDARDEKRLHDIKWRALRMRVKRRADLAEYGPREDQFKGIAYQAVVEMMDGYEKR